jgi:hypothetical protein
VQWAFDLALRHYGRVHCGTPWQWLALPHAALGDRAAAVKPEEMLRLLQELDESPAWERPALGAAELRTLVADPALESCLGLCCERMCRH